jgi:hypothetical protein
MRVFSNCTFFDNSKLLISYENAESFYRKAGFKPEEGTIAMFITDMV